MDHQDEEDTYKNAYNEILYPVGGIILNLEKQNYFKKGRCILMTTIPATRINQGL